MTSDEARNQLADDAETLCEGSGWEWTRTQIELVLAAVLADYNRSLLMTALEARREYGGIDTVEERWVTPWQEAKE